jgi:hypothetical protein
VANIIEYAVRAETHEGKVMTLRSGFGSAEDAEDHPVLMALWKRVWVEPVSIPAPKDAAPVPAPRPWDWLWIGATNGGGHIYLLDATGRKIGVVWGKGGEKEKTADLIIEAVNNFSQEG